MTALVHRLPLNELGRDFVAGDVHGSYQLLRQALRAAHFDVERDRLLLTGDLVDRGPDSAACLALTREPWVHSARGNHEQMALDAFDDNGALQVPAHQVFAMHRNGMSWWLELTSAERVPLLALARQLPLALEVPTHRGTVGLVHADVPQGMSWPEFLEALEQADERTCQIALWGRQRIESQRHEGVPGVGRVFVGHTPQWGGLRASWSPRQGGSVPDQRRHRHRGHLAAPGARPDSTPGRPHPRHQPLWQWRAVPDVGAALALALGSPLSPAPFLSS